MTRLRHWLIRRIAGRMPIALNLTVDGGLVFDKDSGFMVKDCRITGREPKAAVLVLIDPAPDLFEYLDGPRRRARGADA